MVSQRNLIVPGIVTSKPEDLPDPCTCGKSSVANTASVKEVNLQKPIFCERHFKYCLSLYLSDCSSY